MEGVLHWTGENVSVPTGVDAVRVYPVTRGQPGSGLC